MTEQKDATTDPNDVFFNFTRKELAGLLGRDILPSRLREAFNRICGSESMVRLTGAGRDDLLTGYKTRSANYWGLAVGRNYSVVHSGFMLGLNLLGLRIGTGVTSLSDKFKVAFPTWVNYDDRNNLKISFDLDYYLGVQNPSTREQAVRALKITGDVMTAIEKGQTVDFNDVRNRLINEAGLATTSRRGPAFFLGLVL